MEPTFLEEIVQPYCAKVQKWLDENSPHEDLQDYSMRDDAQWLPELLEVPASLAQANLTPRQIYDVMTEISPWVYARFDTLDAPCKIAVMQAYYRDHFAKFGPFSKVAPAEMEVVGRKMADLIPVLAKDKGLEAMYEIVERQHAVSDYIGHECKDPAYLHAAVWWNDKRVYLRMARKQVIQLLEDIWNTERALVLREAGEAELRQVLRQHIRERRFPFEP